MTDQEFQALCQEIAEICGREELIPSVIACVMDDDELHIFQSETHLNDFCVMNSIDFDAVGRLRSAVLHVATP